VLPALAFSHEEELLPIDGADSVELWRRMDLFGRFKRHPVPWSYPHDLATEAGLASACAATGGTVMYAPPAPGESFEQASERMRRMELLLYEQELRTACSAAGVTYVSPASAESEKKQRERVESMQSKVHQETQLRSAVLRQFLNEDLGNLPLSVALCGHMLRADRSLNSVDDLVDRFRSVRLEVVDKEGENPWQTSHPHYFGLVRSVLFSVQRMQGSEAYAPAEKANALHLLAMLSVLPGRETPVGLFCGSASDDGLFSCGMECFERAREMLAQFGLLRPAIEEEVAIEDEASPLALVHVGVIHQLVQRCVLEQLGRFKSLDDGTNQALRSLVGRLGELAARWGRRSHTYARVDDRLAQCVASILDHWSTVSDSMATGPLHLATKAELESQLSNFHGNRTCDFRQAVAYGRLAVESAEALHGMGIVASTIDIADMLDICGLQLQRNGEYKEAQQMHIRALGMGTHMDGKVSGSTLSHLGSCLLGQGQYDQAEGIFRRLFLTQKDGFGAEAPDTLLCAANLASSLSGQGKYAEAEAIHREVHEVQVRVLGAEHPETLMSASNLAVCLAGQGKAPEAERIEREVLGVRKRVLGEEHVDTLKSANNLAISLADRGKHADAERIQREVLGVERRVLGAEHPSTLASAANLAYSLLGRGNNPAAEQILREVLGVEQRVLGAEHPSTLTCARNLATALSRQGKYAEAERLHRNALRSLRRIFGAEHPDTLMSLCNLATTLSRQGKYAEAEAINREVLKVQMHVLGAEHPNTLQCVNNLATFIAFQGKHAEAEQMLQPALEMCQRMHGHAHPVTLEITSNLLQITDAKQMRAKVRGAKRSDRPPAQRNERLERAAAAPLSPTATSAARPLPARRQQGCAAVGCASDEASKLCARCLAVGYCSRECQVADWKARHKVACAEAHTS
jgi:tetratricopeptide (TPR) repeat protein